MGGFSRRTFLQGAAATTGGVVVSGSLQTLLAGAASANGTRPNFFELAEVADLRDQIVRLWLPPGFQYRSFHDTDGPPVVLSDGTTLPGRHDGMGAFKARNGNVWLVRNHEQNNPAPPVVNPQNAFGPGKPYDAHGLGGTTTSLVTPDGEVLDAVTSLNGTMMNCSGGRMPWRAWISCEETVNGPDVGNDFTGVSNQFLEKPHGFIFEVPAGRQSNRTPIKSAGRFAHEAAAYSPQEGIVYLTEDNFAFPSGLYRYIPPCNPADAGHLEDGGRLQMLKVAGVNEAHLEGTQTTGARYAVEWVDIDQPYPDGDDGTFTAPTTNDEALNFVGNQGRSKGAAHFSRLEGATYAKGEVYFTSTQGGGAVETAADSVGGYGNGTGQVWSYRPRTKTLTCRYQSPNAAALELPDNITAHDGRGTIVICEDGPVDNYIRRLDADGNLQNLALNRLKRNTAPNAPRFGEEFAGATFSPDGDTLFVNIQASQAITFAIWGPWGRVL
ncbi:MAG: alkaline phosphatase PhoX [Acidimicrobiales bacterium]